jgi:twitching motility two-component system response regulator PilH
LEVFEAFDPDCIILDILMPEVNGLVFLQQLRGQGATTPVVVLTADIQETTCQECLKLGAEEVVHKPAEGDKLRAIINTVLDSREGEK